MQKFVETEADRRIKSCLTEKRCFSVIAGAGSGKTTSLVTGLEFLKEAEGARLRRDDQRIVCITYTKRAVAVIADRLDWDDLFLVSTLHAFLWGVVKRLTPDIRRALREHVIPEHIEKRKKDDSGGQSKKAVAARERIAILEADLERLDDVERFSYEDSTFSDYAKGELNHDDVIALSAYLISDTEKLRRAIGQRYPYIFVDEAQDTFGDVLGALNKLGETDGLPIIGYFGDPMQQIYDNRAGDFGGAAGSATITKGENYRCSRRVIGFLNSFRKDIQQLPAGTNANVEGSVLITLVRAEAPAAPRKRYTDDQIERASARFKKP